MKIKTILYVFLLMTVFNTTLLLGMQNLAMKMTLQSLYEAGPKMKAQAFFILGCGATAAYIPAKLMSYLPQEELTVIPKFAATTIEDLTMSCIDSHDYFIQMGILRDPALRQ